MTSISRHRGVNLGRPCIDATGEVIDAFETRALQKCDDLQTSHPVMAITDDGLRGVQLFKPSGDLSHRHQLTLHSVDLNRSQLRLPGLSHVQQEQGHG